MHQAPITARKTADCAAELSQRHPVLATSPSKRRVMQSVRRSEPDGFLRTGLTDFRGVYGIERAINGTKHQPTLELPVPTTLTLLSRPASR
jgi:hypothetical protein